MMMDAGFFRLMPDLPVLFWQYPISYINYMAWALQVYPVAITLDSSQGLFFDLKMSAKMVRTTDICIQLCRVHSRMI